MTLESSKKPISVNIQLNDQRVRVHGNVALTVQEGEQVICDVAEKMDTVKLGDQKTEETSEEFESTKLSSNQDESDGLRRRIGKKSMDSDTNTTNPMIEEESNPFIHFPTLDEAKESARQFAQTVIDDLLHFCHLPDWMKDNEFLHTRHRPPTPSYSQCFKSIFRLHTETFNIWTHMVGFFFFVGLAVYYMSRPGNEIQWEDKVAFVPFFVSVVTCLGLSSSFHIIHCHSERVGKFFNKLDYVGIVVLIVGSFFPWLHYAFYCRRQLKLIYMLIILVLGMCALAFIVSDKAHGPGIRVMRTSVFVALGLFAVVPFAHVIISNGYHANVNWLIIMGAVYIFGAVMYAVRIPERLFPGKCDILWQSHQLLHLCVVAGAMIHYWGLTVMAYSRISGSWPCIRH